MSTDMTSVHGPRMLGYLPSFYTGHRVRAIIDVQGHEVDSVRAALTEVLDNFFAARASWGIERWEDELGLPPDPRLTDAQRRERIIARLRGVGTPTLPAVRAVAAAYENGTVEVAEDHSTYTVHVRFVDVRGIPANLADLQAVLRDVVPAHLDIQWLFTWFLWDELDAKGWTWDQLDAQGLTWDQLEVLV